MIYIAKQLRGESLSDYPTGCLANGDEQAKPVSLPL